jgi:hypothetical protein
MAYAPSYVMGNQQDSHTIKYEKKIDLKKYTF